jgi:protein-L-isoaspartate(D-aspartate) O-methyltransferase
MVMMLAIIALGFSIIASAPAEAPSGADAFAAERELMVSTQIEARGVRNPDVLAAMRRVPRHRFVPESVRRFAYADHRCPSASTRPSLSRTSSP